MPDEHKVGGEVETNTHSLLHARNRKKGHVFQKRRVLASVYCHSKGKKKSRPLRLGLGRVLLAGRKGAPGTPAPKWKVFDSSNVDPSSAFHHRFLRKHYFQSNKDVVVSARSLAAVLWERLESPYYKTRIKTFAQDRFPHKSQSTCENACLAENHFVCGRHIFSDRDPIRGESHGKSQAETKIFADGRYKCPLKSLACNSKNGSNRSNCGPAMANEVMMLLNHVRTLEQQHLCNMSLIETLQVELDEARSQLQMLQENQRKFQFKAEAMKTRIAEERSFLKEQEENYIKITVKLVIQELESERKSKQKLEGLYKKAAKEFRLARKSLGKALEDLEREKKARKLMEEVCDELAREIGQDKARVKELKLESLKVREEVEEERRMLQMAEIWREERVRMKLMEAKLELEGKNAALDKLRGQLEIFLKTRMVDHVKSKVVIDEMMDSHHLTSGRHSVDSSSEQQTKQSEQFNGVYADDELHSIEVNCQSLEQVQEIETQKSTQMDFKENTETEDGDKANMFPEVAHC